MEYLIKKDGMYFTDWNHQTYKVQPIFSDKALIMNKEAMEKHLRRFMELQIGVVVKEVPK